MAETPPFASYFLDRSNATGFQFEFFCQRCGTSFLSPFEMASSLAADAGGFALGKAAGHIPIIGDFLGDKAGDALKDRAKDAAFQRAVAQVAPNFVQCPRCRRWRCLRTCWNPQMNLCADCAPIQAAYPPAPLPSQPYPGQPYPGQPAPSQVYPNQPYPAQPYPGQPYASQPFPGQPYSTAPMPQPYQTGAPSPMPYAVAAPPYPPYYGAPVMPPGSPRTSGRAATSLILGVCSAALGALVLGEVAAQSAAFGLPCTLLFFTALFAIIFGHAAQGQIKRSMGVLRGAGKAVTGLVLGYLALLVAIAAPVASTAITTSSIFNHLAPDLTATAQASSQGLPNAGGAGNNATGTPIPVAATISYAAVWRSGTDAEAYADNMTASDLKAKFDTYHAQGRRLENLNVTVANGQEYFSAVWRSGADAEAFDVNMTQDELHSQFQTYHSQGLRLVSLTAAEINGQVLFSGAWRSGTDAEEYWVNLPQSDISAKFQSYHQQHLNLVDLVPYAADGQELYAAVWRGGADAEYYWTNASAENFKAKFDSLYQQGLRLVSLTEIDSDGQTLFTGVWRGGSYSEEFWANITQDELHAKFTSYHNQGYRLVSLDEYP